MVDADGNQDQDVTKKQQQGNTKLQDLQKKVAHLEQKCSRLQHVSNHLATQLETYRQVKDEWEWFFQHSQELLCITDEQGHFIRVNPAFANNLGYSQQQLLSLRFSDFIHPQDRKLTLDRLDSLRRGKASVSFENRYRDMMGNWHWLSWHCPAIDPKVNKVFAIAHDITRQKRSEAEILYKAMHDPLTGLFNRAALEDQIRHSMSRIKRHPGNEIALFMIDLDGFKTINDNYGHQAGDQLLQKVAQSFKAIKRESEFVCRFGGDEFAWLAEGELGMVTESLAERIMETIHKPVELDQAIVRVGCCIGISVFPTLATDVDSLLSQADTAMYSVKKSGKDGYKRYQ